MNDIEQADLEIVRQVGDQRDRPMVRLAGMLSEIADQPQLAAVCCTILAAGLARCDRRMTATALRMLAAHGLATFAKSWVKHSVKRTRPEVLFDEGRYEMRPGRAERHEEGSFPSGHTAGAVAVGGVVAVAYPRLALPVACAVAAVAAVQIPRGKHFASDLAAGALIGTAACAVAELAFGLLPPRGSRTV